jgi:hypothetical protein
MNKVANLSANDRRELFLETAASRAMSPAVAEKDFWVCWVLGKLFSDPVLKDRLIFKGGTSLSKVFGLINRFSEDIDLVLDWELLGYSKQLDDTPLSSKTQQDRFNKQVNKKAAEYIGGPLLARLNDQLGKQDGIICSVNKDDPQTLNISYPAAFSEGYLRPELWLEIGPLASFVPASKHTITPYAAEAFPRLFESPSCEVVAIDAERTFWEKATILHQQAHRASDMPLRYSRHYYDLHQLSNSTVKHAALKKFDLLNDVVSFKQRFYPCSWARYDLACPGNFRLAPKENFLPELQRDYRQMEAMFFGEIPAFADIIKTLVHLEQEINAIR